MGASLKLFDPPSSMCHVKFVTMFQSPDTWTYLPEILLRVKLHEARKNHGGYRSSVQCFQARKYYVHRMLIWYKKERSFAGRIPMWFNNAAETYWSILGDQLSMTSPQDKQLACLSGPHRLEVGKGNAQSISPKVEGPRRVLQLY